MIGGDGVLVETNEPEERQTEIIKKIIHNDLSSRYHAYRQAGKSGSKMTAEDPDFRQDDKSTPARFNNNSTSWLILV